MKYVTLETIGALLLGLLLGVGGCVWFLSDGAERSDSDITREGGYAYINPLLSCDISEDTQYAPYTKLANHVNEVIREELGQGKATRISTYIRDMNTGHWTGVDADSLFAPASLFKVPLFIALLKTSESRPGFLQSPITLSGTDENERVLIQPRTPLVRGQTYSLSDALRAMITESDNNAARALSDRVSQDALNDVYGDFGLTPATQEDKIIVSPKMYMRIFRILYNSSYLERAESQYALELMTRATFADGLVAGVPHETVVSHKFGEREIYAGSNKNLVLVQLHDCGIVYYPRAPYGICVMTEGSDIEQLKTVIARISLTTYNEVKAGALAY